MNTAPPTSDDRPILVIGGTGKTGRRVAKRLANRGFAVRIGSRSATPPFDWNDPATWDVALRGVSAVYITYFPDLIIPGAAETVEAFAKRALANGVRRLVLLSGRGEDGAVRAEQLLQFTAADWTILRASWFSQNFSESFLYDAVLAGDVALPAGEVREPFVDADDIADVAVTVLTEDGHVGKLYELTGPRAITFAQAVDEIARATDRPIHYTPITPEAFTQALAEQQTPPDMVALLDELFTVVLDGRNSPTCDGIQRVLGREPRDFSQYVGDTAATGVWNVAEVAQEQSACKTT